MKKNPIVLSLLAVMLSFVFVACDDDSDPAETPFLKVQPENEISVGPEESINVLDIKSNSAWIISIPKDIDWIEPDVFAGMNDGQISLNVSENISTNDRTAVVTVSLLDKSASVEIRITQTVNSELDVFEHIKDTNFLNYCIQFDLDEDGVLSLEEAAKIKFIDITPNSMTAPQDLIISLEGIEYFPNLISLAFSNNLVSEIDLSQNAKLKELIAIHNKLKSIDVTHCPELEYLYLDQNPGIKSIDVTKNPRLKKLFTQEDEYIMSVDLRNCPELTDIAMFGNNLSEIDFTNNKKLVNIGLDENQITSIDVSMLPSLERLNISGNKLSGKLDLTPNTKLLVLNISKNSFTSVDVTNCTEINTMYCSSNKLTNIDVSNNSKLSSFHCSDNLFKSVDISGCPGMVQFICTGQPELEEINISNCNENTLVSFWAFNNPNMKTLWVWKGFKNIPTDVDWSIQQGVEIKEKP